MNARVTREERLWQCIAAYSDLAAEKPGADRDSLLRRLVLKINKLARLIPSAEGNLSQPEVDDA